MYTLVSSSIIITNKYLFKGVELVFNCQVIKLEVLIDGNVYCAPWRSYALTVLVDGVERVYQADSVLNATGRVPNVVGLGLENV